VEHPGIVLRLLKGKKGTQEAVVAAVESVKVDKHCDATSKEKST
tara:strand:+ start:27267 stop:27398 length:132 start_codon:yes stop_codon:yes gene_type:complete